jgi:hypothetical protein
MSQSAFDNGDPAVDSGGGAAARATAVRAASQELDYRLRGLHGDPTDDVFATSSRADQKRRRRHRVMAKVGGFVAVVALAILLLRAFVFQPFTLPGNAMRPPSGRATGSSW